MPSLNVFHGIGNICQDIDSRNTNGGHPVANFRVAMNRAYTTSGGEKRENTLYLDCQAFDTVAENVTKYLHKGSLVYVSGPLELQQWEDKETGQKRQKVILSIRNVQFLDKGDKSPAAEESQDLP